MAVQNATLSRHFDGGHSWTAAQPVCVVDAGQLAAFNSEFARRRRPGRLGQAASGDSEDRSRQRRHRRLALGSSTVTVAVKIFGDEGA
jgi:hypothetical protein